MERKGSKNGFFGVCFLLLGLLGCGSDNRPDVSGLMKERKIIRFERELFALDKQHPDVEDMHHRYGSFFEVYVAGVLQLGDAEDKSLPEYLSLFLRDSVMNEVNDSVQVRYPDMRGYEEAFAKAFAYYAYYFPQHPIPQIYTHISGFNQSIVVDSSFIGISLDNYLGEGCPFYRMLSTPIPAYMRRRMGGDNIVKDAMFGWLTTEVPYVPRHNDLVSGMLYQGKIVYLLKKILPDDDESHLFDYTPEQMVWCKDNEEEMWEFLVARELLYETGQMALRKYLFDAPFTSDMPQESPGKAVVWNGYRIVCEYVKKQHVSLEALVAEQDYHKVLRLSGYRG